MNEAGSLEFFLGFCRQLREAGLPVGPDRSESYLRALTAIDEKSMRRVYWTGRITLASHRDHLEIYDQVFDSFFLGRRNDSLPSRIDGAKAANSPLPRAVRISKRKEVRPGGHRFSLEYYQRNAVLRRPVRARAMRSWS
jgi:uncharacterized protein with von Willebrand factor type A (vWA) domain